MTTDRDFAAELAAARAEHERVIEGVKALWKIDMRDARQQRARADAAQRTLAAVAAKADEWREWSRIRSTPRIDAFRDAAEAVSEILAWRCASCGCSGPEHALGGSAQDCIYQPYLAPAPPDTPGGHADRRTLAAEADPKCEGLAPFCCGNPSCPAHGNKEESR